MRTANSATIKSAAGKPRLAPRGLREAFTASYIRQGSECFHLQSRMQWIAIESPKSAILVRSWTVNIASAENVGGGIAPFSHYKSEGAIPIHKFN